MLDGAVHSTGEGYVHQRVCVVTSPDTPHTVLLWLIAHILNDSVMSSVSTHTGAGPERFYALHSICAWLLSQGQRLGGGQSAVRSGLRGADDP